MIRAAALAALLAAPAMAEVVVSDATSFTSRSEALVAAPPALVWTALLNWDRWWSPAHSYSGTPPVLDARAGGMLIENWPGGSVRHAVVVHAQAPKLLRLTGGFGPLQGLPVDAVLDFTLKPEGQGTRLTMTYRVGGPASAGLDRLAAPVDQVMSEGFARLVRTASTGKP